MNFKKLGIIFATIVVAVGLFYGGFALGTSSTEKRLAHPKGDGYHWFAEEIEKQGKGYFANDDLLYHSTPDCPKISDGIVMDVYYTDSIYRSQHTKFCPYCMDERLIMICKVWLNSK